MDIVAENGILCFIPRLGAIRNSHSFHPAIGFQIIFAPKLGSLPASLPVKTQNQITVTLHLRPPKSVEKAFTILSVNVWNAIGIPKNLIADFRRGASPIIEEQN